MKQPDQKIYDIFHFEKGDNITRIKPAERPPQSVIDYTHMGKSFILLGTLNGVIYLKENKEKVDDLFSIMFGVSKGGITELPIDRWMDGWAYYQEPDFLNTIPSSNEDELKNKIKEAIEKEDFVLAGELTKQLKRNDESSSD
jgi:hypothetical protein